MPPPLATSRPFALSCYPTLHNRFMPWSERSRAVSGRPNLPNPDQFPASAVRSYRPANWLMTTQYDRALIEIYLYVSVSRDVKMGKKWVIYTSKDSQRRDGEQWWNVKGLNNVLYRYVIVKIRWDLKSVRLWWVHFIVFKKWIKTILAIIVYYWTSI